MAEAERITNELIYEVLKDVQPRIGNIEDGQRSINKQLISVRGHVHALQIDIHNIYQVLARHD